jgi:hypothetical protein
LESVQVEAGRIITGLRVNSSRSKSYSELGWDPLYKRREKQKLILLYKIINGLTQDYMYDKMTVSINICHSVVHIHKVNWRVIYISSSK